MTDIYQQGCYEERQTYNGKRTAIPRIRGTPKPDILLMGFNLKRAFRKCIAATL